MALVETTNLVGFTEMARKFHVKPGTVAGWYYRRAEAKHPSSFPEVIQPLSMGPLFDWAEVVEWWKNYQPAGTHKRLGYLDEEGGNK